MGIMFSMWNPFLSYINDLEIFQHIYSRLNCVQSLLQAQLSMLYILFFIDPHKSWDRSNFYNHFTKEEEDTWISLVTQLDLVFTSGSLQNIEDKLEANQEET